jgi:NADPH:quinone reductase
MALTRQYLVTQLGAQATVDHTGDLASQVRAIAPDGVHVLAHLAGDPGVVELVRDGGRFLSTLLQSPDQLPSQTVTVVPVYANPTREVLDRVSHGLAGGDTTVTVQQVFPLDQAQAALDTFAQGTLGKVVISTD